MFNKVKDFLWFTGKVVAAGIAFRLIAYVINKASPGTGDKLQNYADNPALSLGLS